MTELNTKEAPDVLAGRAGASEDKESGVKRSPHITSISLTVDDGNSQYPDPIVEAIRILARRGRQIREAQEAAARDGETAGNSGQSGCSGLATPIPDTVGEGSEL